MSFELSKVLGVLKLPAKHFVAVSAVSGLLAVAPDRWLAILGLVDFRHQYRAWISLVFLGSTALALAYGISAAWTARKSSKAQAQRVAARERIIQGIGDDERDVLATFVHHNVRVWRFPPDDGAATNLASKRILYRPTQAFTVFHGFQYGIHPWAWEYLEKHPELLSDARPYGEQGQDPSDWLNPRRR